MIKYKVLIDRNMENFENELNDFSNNEKNKVLDVKFSTNTLDNGIEAWTVYGALVSYMEDIG